MKDDYNDNDFTNIRLSNDSNNYEEIGYFINDNDDENDFECTGSNKQKLDTLSINDKSKSILSTKVCSNNNVVDGVKGRSNKS